MSILKNIQVPQTSQSVAYFTMEIGLEDSMKEYAGGLGILAGDTIKTAADMEVNMTAVTLLYKKGYFKQTINDQGEQVEVADEWDYHAYLQDTGKTITVHFKHESINIHIWKYEYAGVTGHTVTVYFLDADVESNSQENRYISYNLYTPYEHTRFKQEVILGIGGVKALQALGHDAFDNYHFNESHAAFGIIPLEMQLQSKEEVKKRVVFTTHTPVEHGHKKYHRDQLQEFLNEAQFDSIKDDFDSEGFLNLSKYALAHAKYANGVSKRHGEVSQKLFPDNTIDYITNGVHVKSWVGLGTQKLFDEKVLHWQRNPRKLKNVTFTNNEIQTMHNGNKEEMLNYIHIATGKHLNKSTFTIGFARRVDGYKRSGFIFKDFERLQSIADKWGGLQIVFAGKAYFDYGPSEAHIANIHQFSRQDFGKLNIVFLEDYGMNISKMMVQGSDLWLNNPLKPLEAAGTSGMKAALNGVPSLSTVDGWWVEGWQEGVTGWALGDDSIENNEDKQLEDLYTKLDNVILPMYIERPQEWLQVMKNAITKNGSYFNTHRMLQEYVDKAYL